MSRAPEAGERVWILTCEHASCAVPREYRSLGLPRSALRDHIGWDLGARALQRVVARELGGAPTLASRWSRLLVDCNRDPSDPSLVLAESDGVRVPGNARVTRAERARRVELFHAPYHRAVERAIERELRRGRSPRLLSIHSFTPVMGGVERRLDVGVLFDRHRGLAHRLGAEIRRTGWRVKYNEPYSGLAGLIYSARRHGHGGGIDYVELEINNALLREPRAIERMGRDVARALRAIG